MRKYPKKIMFLYSDSKYTEFNDAISGKVIVYLLKSFPPTIRFSIVHFIEPNSDFITLLKSCDMIFNLCYGYKEISQARISKYLDNLGIVQTAPSYESQINALDKKNLSKFADTLNVKSPKNYDINEVFQSYEIFILKYRFGGGHKEVMIDQGFKFQEIQLPKKEFIFQRYIYGREFSISIIPNSDSNDLIALPPLEVVPKPPREIFIAGQKFGRTEPDFDPRITDKFKKRLTNIALAAHRAMKLKAYSRIDIKISNSEIFILDVNSMPNLSPKSYLTQTCLNNNITLEDFLVRVIRYIWKYFNYEDK